jgi:hypothetical protein
LDRTPAAPPRRSSRRGSHPRTSILTRRTQRAPRELFSHSCHATRARQVLAARAAPVSDSEPAWSAVRMAGPASVLAKASEDSVYQAPLFQLNRTCELVCAR